MPASTKCLPTPGLVHHVLYFKKKIEVSGRLNNTTILTLNTVEAYDHVANKMTYMPNMIEKKFCHKSVAIKNKLFIVDDSVSNKFVLLKLPQNAL